MLQFIQNLLVGAKLTRFGRSCNLICLIFQKEGSPDEIALHIQCFWRILSAHAVVTAEPDLYHPASYTDPDRFAYDKPGSTLYDEIAGQLFANLEGFTVESFTQTGPLADYALTFANGITLQLLVLRGDGELWRIFVRKSDGPHFVCYPDGIRAE